MTRLHEAANVWRLGLLGMLASAVFVSVMVGTPPAAVAEAKTVDTTVVLLDARPTDIEVDGEREVAYLSVRDEDQIIVVDITTGTIVAEHSVAGAAGLSLSADTNHLYVAQYMAGGIARIDLDDWSVTTVALTELGDPRTFDVAEVAQGVVLVTTAPSSFKATHVVRYDFATATEDVVASSRLIGAYPRLFVDDHGLFAYIGELSSRPSLYRVDLASPLMPIVAEDISGSVTGTRSIAIAPAGDFVVTESGQKLRTTDLTQIGSFEYGSPAISNDGARVYSIGEPAVAGLPMAVADSATTEIIERWDVACPSAEPQLPMLTKVPGSTDLIAATSAALCVIHTRTARFRPLPAGGRFFDDDGSVHESSIEAIAIEGITTGCNPPYSTGFCPNSSVTRGQMAAFLSRALGLSGGGESTFIDDDTSVFESDIARLAGAGITKGCNPPLNTMFCPDEVVTRGQMAAFLGRALGYQATASDIFTDDDGSVFEPAIDALASAGVTRGCNPPANTMFCPHEPVTRAQMATFLARALGLNVRATTSRPETASGTDLAVITKAEVAHCSGVTGEICETVAYAISGEFFLLTGWYAEDWSSLPQTDKNDFSSAGVRLEAAFDGVPLQLVRWPVEIVNDTAHKLYSFQFPDWLSGVHTLDVKFVDQPSDYEWTVRLTITMSTGQPGYLGNEPTPYLRLNLPARETGPTSRPWSTPSRS